MDEIIRWFVRGCLVGLVVCCLFLRLTRRR